LQGGREVPWALSFGLRPLIYASPGASELYPADYLWNSLEDLAVLLDSPPRTDPRQWIESTFAPAKLAGLVRNLLIG
ncbi:MAG: hypothetical protein LBK52_04265, partial [Deltaproteobacteria bacterium]|nr:hypothetical protein [Deltaproteobacteria bacterium]